MSGITQSKVRFWSEENIFKAIHALSDQGVRVNCYQIGKDSSKRTTEILFKAIGKKTTGMGLNAAGKKYFGTWNKCLLAAGLDPKNVKAELFWTNDRFRRAV